MGSSPTSNPYTVLYPLHFRFCDDFANTEVYSKMTINYSSYLSTLSKVTSSADTGFKSVFLDKYDNHFNAAQLNFFTNQFSRIFQNFSPDVINPRVKTKLKLGQTAFISEAPLLGLNALGLVHPTSPKKKSCFKVYLSTSVRK